jgi:hypothetical protein
MNDIKSIAFRHYRFMAREEIQAARLLKKHGLHTRAETLLMNAKAFKKASFQFGQQPTKIERGMV